MFKGKLAIIGAGYVGSTTAYTIMLEGLFKEIALIDVNMDKAEGDALDMNHGMAFLKPQRVTAGGYEACDGADVIIITAGANQKPGETRVDLLRRNVDIFREIVHSIKPYIDDETIIIVVTNPVDVLAYVTYKLSGLHRDKVIGSGTVLDTSRLRYLLSEHTGIDARNIHTYVVGEHGDTEVAAWSATSIAGMSLGNFCAHCNQCDDSSTMHGMYVKVKNAAYEIIEKKGATFYAVALAVRRIVEAIVRNENAILTVSGYMEGEYGINDVYISAPSIVNSSGIRRILEIPLAPAELEGLRFSADSIKELIDGISL